MRGPRIAVALLVAIGVTMLGAQPAAAAQSCTSEVDTSTRFCADYSLAVSDNTAAAPFNLDASVTNTSPGLGSDTSKWFQTITIELTDQTTAGLPVIVPSSQLPNNLMLTGNSSCTPPTYADCAGGNGALIANVTSGFGNFPGSTGAFGIQKVVNVNPPGANTFAHYRATIRSCVTIFGTCFSASDQTVEFVIPEGGGGGNEPLVLTIPAHNQQTVPAGGFGSANVDYSLTSLALHLKGSSDLVDGSPPLSSPVTIFTMPKTCGTNSSLGTFVSAGTPRTVSVPQSFDVVSCPTAQLQAQASGSTAQLDGSGSSSPVGGRTIAKWHWNFGDGSTAETTQPTTPHTYATGGTKTVTLQVEDSAGALSAPVTTQVTVAGPPAGGKTATRTTVTAKLKRGKVRIRGTVRPKGATGRVKIRLLRKKGRKFVLVKKLSKPLRNGAFKARVSGPPRTKRCKVIATYTGDAHHKGSKRSKTFAC